MNEKMKTKINSRNIPSSETKKTIFFKSNVHQFIPFKDNIGKLRKKRNLT